MSPKISIIMPVRNGANYIEEALESIQRQGCNVEIIVVDDGSTDNTADIASKHGCVVLSHKESLGPVVAKNTGLQAAKGDYILFMDHDDKLRDDVLKTMRTALAEAPDVSAIQALVQDFKSPDCGDSPVAIRPDPYYGLFTGAILIRRSVFDTIGLFPTTLTAGEIIDWSDRMNQHGLVIKKIDLVSTDRRVHDNNFGRTRKLEELRNYAAILRRRMK